MGYNPEEEEKNKNEVPAMPEASEGLPEGWRIDDNGEIVRPGAETGATPKVESGEAAPNAAEKIDKAVRNMLNPENAQTKG